MKRFMMAALLTTAMAMPIGYAHAANDTGMSGSSMNQTDETSTMNNADTTTNSADTTTGAADSTASNTGTTGSTGMSATGSAVTASQLDSATIRQIQQALANEGHSPGSVDGVWGPQTTAALREFQSENNLGVTGNLDTTTLSQLGVSVGGSGSMNTTTE